jgi:hypothetical protein
MYTISTNIVELLLPLLISILFLHLFSKECLLAYSGIIPAITRTANTYYQTPKILIAEIKGVSEHISYFSCVG